MTHGMPQWARARQEVSAAREAVARLALDAERIERSEGAVTRDGAPRGGRGTRHRGRTHHGRRVAGQTRRGRGGPRLTPTGREGHALPIDRRRPVKTRGVGDWPWDPGRERAAVAHETDGRRRCGETMRALRRGRRGRRSGSAAGPGPGGARSRRSAAGVPVGTRRGVGRGTGRGGAGGRVGRARPGGSVAAFERRPARGRHRARGRPRSLMGSRFLTSRQSAAPAGRGGKESAPDFQPAVAGPASRAACSDSTTPDHKPPRGAGARPPRSA